MKFGITPHPALLQNNASVPIISDSSLIILSTSHVLGLLVTWKKTYPNQPYFGCLEPAD